MEIVSSFELVIIPNTLQMSPSVFEPDIGSKNIAITLPINSTISIIDPVTTATKRAIFSVSTISTPVITVINPDVYASIAAFPSPAPFSLNLFLQEPAIVTQTNISTGASALSVPMTVYDPVIYGAINFVSSTYGSIFNHWRASSVPYILNAAGTYSTPNAGIPGEEIAYWQGDYAGYLAYEFSDSSPYVSLKSKTISTQNGSVTARHALFWGNSSLTAINPSAYAIGTILNNRASIDMVFVLEPFLKQSGSNTKVLLNISRSSNIRFGMGLEYSTPSTPNLYAIISRNGSGYGNLPIGNITPDQRTIVMVSMNFAGGAASTYINNSRVYNNLSQSFGSGSGNTSGENMTSMTLGGEIGSPDSDYYGNLYEWIVFKDTPLTDNNREQIFRSLGALYGITQSVRNY